MSNERFALNVEHLMFYSFQAKIEEKLNTILLAEYRGKKKDLESLKFVNSKL